MNLGLASKNIFLLKNSRLRSQRFVIERIKKKMRKFIRVTRRIKNALHNM